MTGKINPINVSAGCAHGLPAGACPVCSTGGSGGSSVKKRNEMSWGECYSIGQAMKAAKQRSIDNMLLDQMIQARTARIQRQDTSIPEQILPNVSLIKALPMPVQNSINSIKQVISENISQLTSNMMNRLALIKEKLQFMQDNLTNITDKLAAIFGEQENKIKDLFDKSLRRIKKKLFGFLEMVDGSLEQGDNEKAEEDQEDYNRELADG